MVMNLGKHKRSTCFLIHQDILRILSHAKQGKNNQESADSPIKKQQGNIQKSRDRQLACRGIVTYQKGFNNCCAEPSVQADSFSDSRPASAGCTAFTVTHTPSLGSV